MKKVLIILLLTQSLLSCAQTIYPLNSPDAPVDSYIKDINNEFDPYLGTWEATWNNKKITLYLIKMSHTYTERFKGGHYYEDFVIGKYTVVDLTSGAELENTTGITNIDDVPIKSTVLVRNKNQLRFLYSNRAPTSADCDILSTIILTKDLTNPNILTYKYFVNNYNYKGCPYTNLDDIPINIPKKNIVFHKL